MFSLKSFFPVFVGIVSMLISLSVPAMADLTVIESTAPDLYPLKKVLKNDASLSLSKNTRIKLLKTPGGTTHVITGPYTGTLSDYTSKSNCKWWKKSIGDCGSSSKGIPGGTRGAAR